MDLDDDELKATRKINGVAKEEAAQHKLSEEEIKKIQEDANKKIEDIMKQINDACEELSKMDGMQHLMVVGYVDIGTARGFVSANSNLKEIESQTTFLLDYTSRNIKEAVRKQAQQNMEKLKEVINKEEENSKNEK